MKRPEIGVVRNGRENSRRSVILNMRAHERFATMLCCSDQEVSERVALFPPRAAESRRGWTHGIMALFMCGTARGLKPKPGCIRRKLHYDSAACNMHMHRLFPGPCWSPSCQATHAKREVHPHWPSRKLLIRNRIGTDRHLRILPHEVVDRNLAHPWRMA